jgi:1,4-dihydroxy-2-naphthoate octaprenyltransferase
MRAFRPKTEEGSNQAGGHLPRAVIWWRACRYHFVPPSFLPAALGAVLAWALTGKFSLVCYLIVVLATTINHIALNMTDDYFDYKHSVDEAREQGPNPYSGGSGLLTSGALRPSRMRLAFSILYLVTIAAGLYLTVTRGWAVLVFGAIGMFSAYFYAAPPLRYGYHGFGEISQLLNFSLVIGLGSFYVQAGRLSWEAAFVLLPLGLMMFAMITINEIPDVHSDAKAGKRTLVVRLGRLRGVWLYGGSMSLAYVVILCSPLLGLSSYWTYLVFLTIPWFITAFIVLRKNYRDPVSMSPANMLTIRIHNFTGILLVGAYVIQGGIDRRGLDRMGIPVAVLLLLYLPVALAQISPRRGDTARSA